MRGFPAHTAPALHESDILLDMREMQYIIYRRGGPYPELCTPAYFPPSPPRVVPVSVPVVVPRPVPRVLAVGRARAMPVPRVRDAEDVVEELRADEAGVTGTVSRCNVTRFPSAPVTIKQSRRRRQPEKCCQIDQDAHHKCSVRTATSSCSEYGWAEQGVPISRMRTHLFHALA